MSAQPSGAITRRRAAELAAASATTTRRGRSAQQHKRIQDATDSVTATVPAGKRNRRSASTGAPAATALPGSAASSSSGSAVGGRGATARPGAARTASSLSSSSAAVDGYVGAGRAATARTASPLSSGSATTDQSATCLAGAPPVVSCGSGSYSPPERYCFLVSECHSYGGEYLCAARRHHLARPDGVVGPFERDLPWGCLPDAPEHEMVDALLKAVPAYMAGQVFEDVSRGANRWQCPITKERYVAPHILNLNGVTYSLDAISRAITDTLCVGKPLVLEHGTVAPHDLYRLCLYPNLSLADMRSLQHAVRFSVHPSVVIPRPDVARAVANNVPEVSARLVARRTTTVTPGNGWSEFVTSLYNTTYRPHRPDQPLHCMPDQRATFCDLVLDDVQLPVGGESYKRLVHWDNVVFRRCILIFSTVGSLSMTFTSCCFEDCVLYFSGSASGLEQGVGATLAGCEIAGCSYVLNDEGYTLWIENSLKRHLLQANGAIGVDVVRRVVAPNTVYDAMRCSECMSAAETGQWLIKRSKYG